MTDDQRAFLAALATRPNGGVVRGDDQVRILNQLLHTGYVNGVYEIENGAMMARVSPAGRTALAQPYTHRAK